MAGQASERSSTHILAAREQAIMETVKPLHLAVEGKQQKQVEMSFFYIYSHDDNAPSLFGMICFLYPNKIFLRTAVASSNSMTLTVAQNLKEIKEYPKVEEI